MALACVLALSAAFPTSASAGQISSLRSRAAQISRNLLRDQLQIGAFRQQYDVASALVQRESAVISRTMIQVQSDQRRIATDTAEVRRQAILDYMSVGSVATGGTAELLTGGERNALAHSEYQSIASGNITNAIDRLRSSRVALQSAQATLQHQQTVDQLALDRQANFLQQAESTQMQLSAEQSQVTGQLAAAVNEQQVAQARAAAAAVRAAQLAAQHNVQIARVASNARRQEAATANRVAQRASPVSRAVSGGATPASSGSSHSSSTASISSATTSSVASSSSVSSSSRGYSSGSSSTSSSSGGSTGASGGAVSDPSLPPFLQCVLRAESSGNYGAVSPNGQYRGAFQFSQSTWNAAAQDAGLPALVGVAPNTASKAEQDTLAVALYNLDGQQPWYDPCRTS